MRRWEVREGEGPGEGKERMQGKRGGKEKKAYEGRMEGWEQNEGRKGDNEGGK